LWTGAIEGEIISGGEEWDGGKKKSRAATSVADLVLFYPLGMNFFRILDPEGMFFGEIFIRILVLLYFLLIAKKGWFYFYPSFYVM
jgi:hypothetical protein